MSEIYKGKKWERLRRAVLARDGYQCQVAKRYGITQPANVVHHVFPVEAYPEYKWCAWNLIAVSDEMHNMLHDRATHELSPEGEKLRRELAIERGIETESGVVLVIGNPGTGKTAYARKHLGNGVVYDLDYIAGAIRYKDPKQEYHKAARMLANSLAAGFAEAARQWSRTVIVIRTAPTVDELRQINPSKLVVMYGGYNNESLTPHRRTELARRIKEVVAYARGVGTEIEEHTVE